MKRSASAIWTGDLKQGQGKFSVGSGAFKDQGFTFRTRFEADRARTRKSSSPQLMPAASAWP